MSDDNNEIDQPGSEGADSDENYDIDADGSVLTLQLDNTDKVLGYALTALGMTLLSIVLVKLFGLMREVARH